MGTLVGASQLEMRRVLEAWSSGLILVGVRVDAESRLQFGDCRGVDTRALPRCACSIATRPAAAHAGGTSCLSAFLPCPTAQFFFLAACNRRRVRVSVPHRQQLHPLCSKSQPPKHQHWTSEFPTNLDPKHSSRAAAQPDQDIAICEDAQDEPRPASHD